MIQQVGEEKLESSGNRSSDDVVGGSVPQPDEAAQTMPLMAGMNGPDNLPGMDDDGIKALDGSRFGRGTLVFLLICVIGAGSLYAMRMSQAEVAASPDTVDAEEKINLALARMTASMGGNGDEATDGTFVSGQVNTTDAIIAMFTADRADRQVPLEWLKKNPFMLIKTAKPKPRPGAIKPTISKEELRLRALKIECAGLRLQTVMQGKVPMAIVDGQIVKAGQFVGSFKVTAIAGQTVLLECDGHHFTLAMSQ